MHTPTGLKYPGRGEGGRLQAVCEYNAFWDQCHGITKKRKCRMFSNANTSLGSKGEETSTTISLPLYFHNRNIWTTTMMTLASTITSLVEATMHKSNFSAAILSHFEYNVIMMSLWCHYQVVMMPLSRHYNVITMPQLFYTSSHQAMDFVKLVNMCSNYLSLVMNSMVWPGVFGVLPSFRPIVYQHTVYFTEYLSHLAHGVLFSCACNT